MDAIKNKFAKVKDQLKVAEDDRDRLEQECKEWKHKYDEMEKQKEDSERKQKLMGADLESAEDRLSSARDQLGTLEKQLDDTQRDVSIKALNVKYEKAMDDLDDARVEKKDMDLKISKLESEKGDLSRKLKLTESDLEQAEDKLSEMIDKKNSIESDFNDAKIENDSLKANVEAMEEHVEYWKKRYAEKEQELKDTLGALEDI